MEPTPRLSPLAANVRTTAARSRHRQGTEKFFVSLAHTDEDVETTIEAFRSAIGELRESAQRTG
jgi:glutamate-1-semialdehyde aminotransferase